MDGYQIIGSPTPLRLISDTPDLAQSELTGGALSKAVAGKPATFRIKCKDKFGNPAQPGTDFHFGMAMLNAIEGLEKKDRTERATLAERWRTAPAHPFSGEWHDEEFEVRYVADIAGNLELYVWCEQGAASTATRQALPGSPFAIHCAAGRAHAQGSSVSGFTRIDPNAEQQRAGVRNVPMGVKAAAPQVRRSKARERCGTYEESIEVYSGEPISVRPKIRDRLGNNTAAPEGALIVSLDLPEGLEPSAHDDAADAEGGGSSGRTAKAEQGPKAADAKAADAKAADAKAADAGHQAETPITSIELKPTISLRSGLTHYDVRYEPQRVGRYAMNIVLSGAPIAGSPVVFECIPNLPDISKSFYTLPEDESAPGSSLFSQRPYSIIVTTLDRCGNRLDHGGSQVTGRLQSANLPPQQDAVLEVDDRDDGTYEIHMSLKAAADLKVIISVDKDRQGDGGGEFAPIPMSFISEEALKARLAKEAAKAQWLQAGAAAAAEAGVNLPEPGTAPALKSADEVVQMAVDEFAAKGQGAARRRTGAGPAAPGSPGKAALKKAASDAIDGMGKPEERRDKPSSIAIVAEMAIEAEARQPSTGVADATSSGSSPSLTRRGANAKSSFGSATSSGGAGASGDESAEATPKSSRFATSRSAQSSSLSGSSHSGRRPT